MWVRIPLFVYVVLIISVLCVAYLALHPKNDNVGSFSLLLRVNLFEIINIFMAFLYTYFVRYIFIALRVLFTQRTSTPLYFSFFFSSALGL